MKKILLGFMSSVVLTNAMGCDSSTFSGVFVGAGVSCSFDKDKLYVDAAPLAMPGVKLAYDKKKSKACPGGSLIVGYGHQFKNNVYVAIMHESSFHSKAEVKHSVYLPIVDEEIGIKIGKKTYSPSFGLACGYVINNAWNIGIRGGIFKDFDTVEGEMYLGNIRKISPYLGVYGEYRVKKSLTVFAHCDYKFGEKVKENYQSVITDVAPIAIPVAGKYEHKRSALKLCVGVKYIFN